MSEHTKDTARYEQLPQWIKDNANVCLWKYEQRKGQEKPAKVPYQATGFRARSNDASTFTTFDKALGALKSGTDYAGLGLGVFGELVAIDKDSCVNKDGSLDDMAQDIIAIMNGYTEYSPSGKGIRILCLAKDFTYDKTRYLIMNQKLGLEIYVACATNKFVTLTGHVIQQGEIGYREQKLRAVLEKYMLRKKPKVKAAAPTFSYLTDDSVIAKASACANGNKFKRLWEGKTGDYNEDSSRADMALAGILAFWCGGDIVQMDRLFRQSGLMRDKWDRSLGDSTYGQHTLAAALSQCESFYSPLPERSSAEDDFSELPEKLKELRPEKNPRYHWSDIGSGRLFADIYQQQARYVPERKCWYVYRSGIWKQDVGSLEAMTLCMRLADALLLHALSIPEERARAAYLDYFKKWQMRGVRETFLKDAQSVYPISLSDFDKDPYVVNCKNGTLHLDTGAFTEHRSEDKLTKMLSVKYDPEARCERFERFIEEITSEDRERARFLQKAYGYGLSGDTSYECMFIEYGPSTRNGKGTLNESALKVLGSYGCTARPETIALKLNRDSSAPSEDIARLAAVHTVSISEPAKGMVLSAALVKSMTGNDTINARFLHENSFDFVPQFKMFINCNYLPIINDMTLFTSGRLFIIPFDRHFEEHEQDITLKRTFAKPENQSAILNWLIAGYQMLCREGFTPPESIRAATAAYQRESDKMGLFVEEHLIPEASNEERTSEVYNAYRGWCHENGYYIENSRNFNQALRTIGQVERRRPRHGGGMTTLLLGYRLNYPEFL